MTGASWSSGELRLAGLTRRFGAVPAVDRLDLEVPAGSFFALLGPSGCGKTTTLRMVAGLLAPTAGTVCLGGRDITGLRPYRRPVNTVFQSYALFPHLDVGENVAFGLRRRGVRDVHRRVARMLSLVELDGLQRRRPSQLSGGQQQRVALARALVNEPALLLLDEPLGALDRQLRRQMQAELKRVQAEVGVTFLHVTHDQEEAMGLADTIAVLCRGRIEQVGPPAALYELPATRFVADFLGRSNLIAAEVAGRLGGDLLLRANGSRFAVPAARARSAHGRVWLGVRPERVRLAVDDSAIPDGANGVRGIVTDACYAGLGTEYRLRTAWGQELAAFCVDTGSAAAIPAGTPVTAVWSPGHAFLVDRAGAGP